VVYNPDIDSRVEWLCGRHGDELAGPWVRRTVHPPRRPVELL